jgi:hypothetical protein
MPLSPVSGHIILRSLTEQNGLQETQQAFDSLEGLFQLVLQTQAPLLVDRIILRGLDEQGQERLVNFVFRSVQKQA